MSTADALRRMVERLDAARIPYLLVGSFAAVSRRDDFALTQFDRRDRAVVAGVDVWVASAEDTVLSKLVWAKRGGGSERQLRDVGGIVAVQGAALDRAYVESWARRMAVEDLWRQVLDALPPV